MGMTIHHVGTVRCASECAADEGVPDLVGIWGRVEFAGFVTGVYVCMYGWRDEMYICIHYLYGNHRRIFGNDSVRQHPTIHGYVVCIGAAALMQGLSIVLVLVLLSVSVSISVSVSALVDRWG